MRLPHLDHDHHGHLTPSGPLAERPLLLWALIVVVVGLAVVASYDQGSVFDTWDVPIQHWVEDHRTSALDTLFLTVSRMGSNVVIFSLGLVAAVVAWFRCPPLSIAIIGAVALRPVFEFVMKDVVSRPRPDFDRMVDGIGFSHPSGHVFATVTLYSLLPAVAALYLGRRRVWWGVWAFVVALVPLVAMCRVYLGVHWATDAFAGLLLGGLYLAAVERIFHHHHLDRCREDGPLVEEETVSAAVPGGAGGGDPVERGAHHAEPGIA
jgi:undecaprenyl-diphosphatase